MVVKGRVDGMRHRRPACRPRSFPACRGFQDLAEEREGSQWSLCRQSRPGALFLGVEGVAECLDGFFERCLISGNKC